MDPSSAPPAPSGWPPAPPLLPQARFQHRYGRHLLLFFATFLTTTYAQALLYLGLTAEPAGVIQAGLFGWGAFLNGLWYSIPLLTILARARVRPLLRTAAATTSTRRFPTSCPRRFSLTGTFGAVIRIRERFPSKRALFDIGVAGPIAGFVVLVPFLFWGVTKSELAPVQPGSLWFGEPLLFQLVAALRFGPLPDGLEVVAHPMAMAAWWGMLATALNLLPFGQLDGGHIVYALLGPRAKTVSIAHARRDDAADAQVAELDRDDDHDARHGVLPRLPPPAHRRRRSAARSAADARRVLRPHHLHPLLHAGPD